MEVSKKKILLIEDDLYTRELYEEVLKSGGYEVVTAFDGQMGLNRAIEGGFSIILCDVVMPVLDGMGVLKALQTQVSKIPNGPVIMLTNLSHDPIIQEAERLGAKGYLIKSDLNPQEVLEKVGKYLMR